MYIVLIAILISSFTQELFKRSFEISKKLILFVCLFSFLVLISSNKSGHRIWSILSAFLVKFSFGTQMRLKCVRNP